MVATMAQAAASSYYLESQRSFRHPTEYYTAGEEPDGVWFNPSGLLGLSDTDKIDSKHFHRLYNGFHPETGDKLTKNAGSEKRSPGLDITFSADKSVSALWAIADDRLRTKLEKAHNDAARMALQEIFIKECSYTRTRVGGREGEIKVLPAHMLGTMFQHGSSRAGDPQLHTHCVIFNAVQTETDGKWRALHQKPLYRWIKAAGACYRSYLASNLDELEIAVERYGKDNAYVRIKNIPEELEKLWSKRRSQIVDAAAELGFETGENSTRAELLRVKTRERKRGDQDPDERHNRWKQECEDLQQCAEIIRAVHYLRPSESVAGLNEWWRSINELPHVLTRLQAVFRTPDLAEAIYNLHDPSLGALRPWLIERTIERVLRHRDLVALDREPRSAESIAGLSHTVPLSTRNTLEMENETREFALSMSEQSGFALPAAAIEGKIEQVQAEDYPLSDEQTSAIRYVAGRSGAISIIQGAAGSGKTTTMRPIVDLYKEHGYNFIATAIAWRTAVELANDCDIVPLAADKLLKLASSDRLHLDEKSIIVVEEAGMLSTRHTHRILKLAKEHGAKVILLGDIQQQQPIEAGPGLRLVHDVTGGHRVDTIRRQQPDAEDILRDVHGLDPQDAIVQAARLSPEDRRLILGDYNPADPPESLVPWQITASQDFKNGDAKDAIEAYYKRDRIHFRTNPESTVTKLVDDWHRFVTENPDKSCVVLARTHQEITLLSLQMRERIRADLVDPKSAVVTVSRGEGKKREHYNLEIRTGDRLRVGATNLDKKIYTGSLLTVEDVSVHGAPFHHEERVLITARDDRGRKLTFYHDEIRDFHGNIRLDHGFALTMTAAQGLTVDRAFVLADDAPARETIYPAATRHRERLDFYISRDGPLNRIKVNLPDQGAALQQDITDQDILDHLASRWSRHQPKEAASDYTSEELLQEVLANRKPLRQATLPQQDTQQEDTAQPQKVPVNDNSHTLFSWASRHLRQTALDLRYGNTAALVAQGHREVLASYQQLRERAQTEGANVALSPEFKNTLFRQAQVLGAAKPFLREPERFRDLLQRRASLEPQDLNDFAAQYARAKAAQRKVHQNTNEDTAVFSTAASPDPSRHPGPHQEPTPERASNRQSRSLPRAAELSANLAARAEDVCQHYLPHGKRDADTWQASSIQPSQGQVIEVQLAGPNAGKWRDSATGARGDLLDLIRHTKDYGSIAEAMRDATKFLDARAATQTLQPASAAPEERTETNARRARELYDRARPITADDPAGRYLANHGLDIPGPDQLRYHDRVYYLHGDDLRHSPAILAPITTTDRTMCGVEKILITHEGEALQTDPHAIKSHSSASADTGIWFGDLDAQRLAVCQSVPDALSILSTLDAERQKQTAILAIPATHGLDNIPLLPQTSEIVVVQAAGPAADEAWQVLQDKHADSQISLDRILTKDTDLATILREDGPDALRDLLEPLSQPLDTTPHIQFINQAFEEWNSHVDRAREADVHPFYAPGHQELIDRFQDLRDNPPHDLLTPSNIEQIDTLLQENTRLEQAGTHVHNHVTQLQHCHDHFQKLADVAHKYNVRVEHVHSYEAWHDTAERLLAAGKAIVNDRKAYGPCLEHNPGFRNDVVSGLRQLTSMLGLKEPYPAHHHPECYLQPVAPPLSDSHQAAEAHATYGSLRDQWHDHLTHAQSAQTHPYDLPEHAPLIDAMKKLHDNTDLADSARNALNVLVNHHSHDQRALAHIDNYFSKALDTLEGYKLIKELKREYADLTAPVEGNSGYIAWTRDARKVLDSAYAILHDHQSYGVHLQQHPDDMQLLQSSLKRLNDALGQDDLSLHSGQHHGAELTPAIAAHPYDVNNHAPLIDAMNEFRNQSHASETSHSTLDLSFGADSNDQQIHADILNYFHQACRSLEQRHFIEELKVEYADLTAPVEGNSGYISWTEDSEKLVEIAHSIIDDQDQYAAYLQQNPETMLLLQASLDHLNAALGRDDPSLQQDQHQQAELKEAESKEADISHSISMDTGQSF